MTQLDDLRVAYESADQQATGLTGEYETARNAALAELKAQYKPQIDEAVEAAAKAQKAYCDAEAAHALLDRPDGESIAQSLGLELPDEQ